MNTIDWRKIQKRYHTYEITNVFKCCEKRCHMMFQRKVTIVNLTLKCKILLLFFLGSQEPFQTVSKTCQKILNGCLKIRVKTKWKYLQQSSSGQITNQQIGLNLPFFLLFFHYLRQINTMPYKNIITNSIFVLGKRNDLSTK